MVALILCGGQSERMGRDKGLLRQSGKTWAQTAAEKIALLGIPLKISVNKKQEETYEAIFSQDELVIDNDSLDLKGPLLGVLSCHLDFPGEDLMVLACDMLNMKTDFLFMLLEKYQQQSSDAYIFSNEGKEEPLCGIYTARALSYVIEMYNTKKLHTFSMKFILEHLNVCTVPLAEEDRIYFQNFNSPAGIN